MYKVSISWLTTYTSWWLIIKSSFLIRLTNDYGHLKSLEITKMENAKCPNFYIWNKNLPSVHWVLGIQSSGEETFPILSFTKYEQIDLR